MGIFRRGAKKLRGRITDKGDSYMLGSDEKMGIIIFSTESYLRVPPGYDINSDVGQRVPLWHPGTNENLEGDVTKEGDFVVWSVTSKIKDSIFTSFETDTEKYIVHFFYQATQKQRELGLDSVWKILNSLVKYPGKKIS